VRRGGAGVEEEGGSEAALGVSWSAGGGRGVEPRGSWFSLAL